MDDDVGRRNLLEELGDGMGEGRGAKGRRGAEGDDVRPPSGALLLLRRSFHFDGSRLARRDVADLCAEQACQERIGRRTLRLRAVGDEDAAKSQPRSRSGGHARVIRLHAAARDERIGLIGHGIGGHQPHLADFVAAKGKADRVVALDEQAGAAAESVPEAVQLLDRRWSGRKRNRRQRGERAKHPAMISMDCVAGSQFERDPAGCAATS